MPTTPTSQVERLKHGDPSAFEEVYEQCQSSIFTFLYYRIGDQTLAEDLTAEVFVRLVEKIDTYQDTGRPILAWLYTIARNLLVDRYRKNGNTPHLPLVDDLIAEEHDGPAVQAERRLTEDCLRSALEHLTEQQQQVILLKFVEGYSNAETGQIIGCSEGAVKSLQHRALAALRRHLERLPCYE